ncbi:tripartite tricarboxylate transporter substrate binding protein [Chelativorans sp. AA-79]|uniref:Bug family tripartite tricarboxylate transporter substrate binding protein n=1 Tax=Chelativorans sp. AA-79 TaxID=3028735 RepID=UPI0023F62543|nr:tripartite tricarboxylate transporter substrate binding protein [Chelativorans sp. AA-79]WEX12275.1 tripartite tricarboxylate transporter substrate binding protein [Chelativorans sp. AA-79]
MNFARFTRRAAMAATLLTASLVNQAFAQDAWPTKPVTMVIPFSPGGSTDLIGWLITQELSKELGQNVVTEYKPGAGGLIGATAVSQAAPDGYTFVLSGVASNIIAPVKANSEIDPINDFTNVAVIGGGPTVLVVHPDVKVSTVKEFVDLSKATAEGLSVVNPGIGTTAHLFLEMFRAETGAKMVPIAYAGSGPAAADLVANQVPYGFMTLIAVSEFVKSGQIKLLGMSSEARSPLFPDVPTLRESGFPNLIGTSWFSISAPAGLPQDIAKKMNATVNKILADKTIRDKLISESVEVSQPLDLKGVDAFFKAELDRWSPIIRAMPK